jgi:hypothetical protein
MINVLIFNVKMQQLLRRISLFETEDFLLLFSGQKSKQKDLSRWKSNHP